MKGKKKAKYYGTVAPQPNFNASSDASVLQDAIETKGVSTYMLYYMMDLKGTNQITRFLFQRLWSCALRKVNVKHNLSLTGVDEDVIVAVLVKRNNEQRQKIKVVYEASTGEVSTVTLMKTKEKEATRRRNKPKHTKVQVCNLQY